MLGFTPGRQNSGSQESSTREAGGEGRVAGVKFGADAPPWKQKMFEQNLKLGINNTGGKDLEGSGSWLCKPRFTLLKFKIIQIYEVFYTSCMTLLVCVQVQGQKPKAWGRIQLCIADRWSVCSWPTRMSDKSLFHLSSLLASFFSFFSFFFSFWKP